MSEPSNVDWELCKENVQPLRQGRNATSLSAIFTVSKDEMSVQYTQEMLSFENNLMTYMGEDPLEIWIMYIKWIEDNRPQGGGPLLVAVLQKCIQKFYRDPRYVNDLRYLDVWNKHVRCCGNALEVYNYLYCNKIFSKTSEFYIDWALELESSNNFKEANAVYDKGIRAEAEPKDGLLSHQQDFLVRMARNVLGNLQSPTDENDLSGDHRRATLALLKPKDNAVGVLRNETIGVNSGEIQSSSATASVLKRNRPDFNICGDENQDVIRLAENYTTPGFDPKAFLLPSCNKENVQKPGKWTKNRLRCERHVLVKGGNDEQPFEIHQDATSGVEPRPVASLDVLNSKEINSASANILAIVNHKRVENCLQKFMYCKEKIYGGITEVSFEELRAARWFAKQKKIQRSEEMLLKQRDMYEEMLKKTHDDILAEVKNLLKDALPTATVTSETIAARIRQRIATVPSFHPSSASCAQQQDIDQCLRRADNYEYFTPLCLEGSIIPKVEIETIPEKLVSPKISIHCDPLELCDIKPESEKFCIHEDSGIVQEAEILTDASPVGIPKVEGDDDEDDVFTNNENNENVPPVGYVQVRETGPLSGILLPSKRVAYLPIDENESDSEIEDFQPTHHLGSKNIANNFEITSGMPTSTCKFAAELFIKSTPLGHRTSTTDDDCTVIPKCPSNEDGLPQQCLLLTEPVTTRSPENLRCSTSTYRSFADAVITSTSLEQRAIVTDGKCMLTKFQKEDNKLSFTSLHNTSLERIPSAGVKQVRNCSVGEVTEPFNGVYETNPFSDEFLNNYLLTLENPITCNENYTTVNRKLPAFRSKADVVLGNRTYTVKQTSVAKGAFAKIHLATFTHLGNTHTVALKVQLPPRNWEYYISREIETRMLKVYGNTIASLFARITNAYIYNDGSVFVSNYCPYGNLLDLINAYHTIKLPIPESLTMYYAIELLDMIQKLHLCKIIHADIKPDNILLQDIPQISAIGKDASEFFASARSRPSLLLTDFGKSIDMLSLPPGTKFCYQSAADGLLCPEMMDQKPWTYQPDYFGVASCIHCMLFGTYISLEHNGGSWVMGKKVQRCRAMSKVWLPCFHTLLNIPGCDNLPDIDNLRSTIQEDFIQSGKYKNFGDNTRQLMCLLKGK